MFNYKLVVIASTSTATEINLLDGSQAGTVVNSKAVIYGASGEINATTLKLSGSAITSTADEINILDGVTANKDELNLFDGSQAGAVVNSKAVIFTVQVEKLKLHNLNLVTLQ